MNKKRVITEQKYEQYWKLTLEYSDFYGIQFNKVLEVIVNFIDKYNVKHKGLNSSHYHQIQKLINSYFHKADQASTRKSINQMFKLGFINNLADGYHFLTKKFLKEKDRERKKTLYSRIVYENASFARSFTTPSNFNEVKFLIKTLESCGPVTKQELLAIMFCKPSDFPKGYLTKEQLHDKVRFIVYDDTAKRKYNQVSYLKNLCKSLSGVYVGPGKNGKQIITLDPNSLLDRYEREKLRGFRDPYLQKLFKMDLINEYKKLYNSSSVKCVLEKKRAKLIASHIKPYRSCTKEEEFDVNNGLLLSKEMDYLFDKGYMSFDENGCVILTKKYKIKNAGYVKTLKLDKLIYNVQRKKYMIYHRNNILR